MGRLTDAVARDIRSLYLRLYFTRDRQGALLYVPGGIDNPLARHAYPVPDEETARRIEALDKGWYASAVAVVIVCLYGLFLAVAITPSHGGLVAPAILLLAFGSAALAQVLGKRTALRVGLKRLDRPRSTRDVAEGLSATAGGSVTYLTLFLVAGCLVNLAGTGMLFVRGNYKAATWTLIATIVMTALTALYIYGSRMRRLAVDNDRLEGIVRERTVALREANAKLEARVADQVAHLGRLGQLRHFFAAPVAEMILGNQGFDPSRVHRKELSVISADLRGFTAFSETTEPEEVIAVLRAYHTVLGGLVNRHEATLEHFAGENAMVFLNDPLDVPDHPRRAIALAVELREAVRPLLEDWRRLGYDLGLGIGIASGYATIGTVGYEGRWEYAAIGSVCNLAARLCAEAKDGHIVTTHRVLSRVGGAASTEPLGELVLKGISRPVAGFNVLALA